MNGSNSLYPTALPLASKSIDRTKKGGELDTASGHEKSHIFWRNLSCTMIGLIRTFLCVFRLLGNIFLHWEFYFCMGNISVLRWQWHV